MQMISILLVTTIDIALRLMSFQIFLQGRYTKFTVEQQRTFYVVKLLLPAVRSQSSQSWHLRHFSLYLFLRNHSVLPQTVGCINPVETPLISEERIILFYHQLSLLTPPLHQRPDVPTGTPLAFPLCPQP